MDRREVGDTIPAGTLVLITRGSHSDHQVIGLFRAPVDVVVPASAQRMHGTATEMEPDAAALSVLLEEMPYVQVWQDS